MPSQPSAKLSKHGRLTNAHKHHITLPSASPDVWYTMHATKQTRWSMRPYKWSDIFCLTNQRGERECWCCRWPASEEWRWGNFNERGGKAECMRLLNVELDWDPDHLSKEPLPLEGPPIPITIDMVKKAISKMKLGKAAGPSGIVVEMIKAAGDTGATMICDLATAIIRDGKVPSDWEQSFIFCLYKGKGLKLTKQVMKIIEKIVNGPGSVYWGLPVWLCPRKRHYRSDAISAGEIPRSEQEALWRRRGWKTKVMICGTGLHDLLQSSGEYSCAVCQILIIRVHGKCP